jgi:hypothetical protein
LLKTKETEDILINSSTTEVFELPEIIGVKSATVAQCGRFFAANLIPEECLLQVNDIDVIPLKDFWNPNENEFTIFGHDTTGYGYIPIHYATARASKWYELMKCTGSFESDLIREINITKDAYSDKWEQYWFADWDLFTKRCGEDISRFTFIDRGMVHIAKYPTALSRVDRYDYEKTLNQPNIIDIHCENNNVTNDRNVKTIADCLVKSFGDLPTWYYDYISYFKNKNNL